MEDLFLLNGLDLSAKEEIINSLNDCRSYKKGEIIYSSQSFEKAIGIILSGKAIAISGADGVIMRDFEAHDIFGAAAVFSESLTYVSTVVAKENCKVLFIGEEKLKEIFIKHPIASLNYIKFLSKKIHFLNKKLNLVSTGSAEDTVLKYLSSVKSHDGTAYTGMNMTSLAKALGLSRASLYRAVDNLQKNGKIKKENNNFKVIQL